MSSFDALIGFVICHYFPVGSSLHIVVQRHWFLFLYEDAAQIAICVRVTCDCLGFLFPFFFILLVHLIKML